MTREEAIAILNHNVSACLHGTEWGEALDMAIKALGQEPVLDRVKVEIEKAVWEDVVVSLDGTDEVRIPRLVPDDVFEIIDKYKAESVKKMQRVYCCEVCEPTIKNDSGVDCIVDILGSYTDLDIPYKREIAENILANLPSVTPQLSSELEKNSKKLENDFGESDCIDRAELLKAMDTWDKFGYTAQYGLERLDKDDKGFVPYVKYDNMVNCVKGMPSVTLQEPRCKDCKWWKDSDGEYRRGCRAESQCPINRREVFEGNGYCYMFSPKADMREVGE